MNKRAYMIYHMGEQGIYDEEIVEFFERGLSLVKIKGQDDSLIAKGEKNITARYAMGAVCGYWKLNIGSAKGLEYWEHFLKN